MAKLGLIQYTETLRKRYRKKLLAREKKARENSRKLTSKERETQLDKRYLEARKNDRVAGRPPKNEVKPKKLLNLAIRKNWNTKSYKAALEALPSDPPTEEQLNRLKEAKSCGPNYLGRTASLTAGFKFETWSSGTNGFTTQNLLMPAADTNRGESLHPDFASLTQGEILYMLGQHLVWNDIASDEFLSYSIDPLFLVYHALGRQHKAQGSISIQFIDRRKAKAMDGEAAAFYHALDIYDVFDVRRWPGWAKPTLGKLLPRKFTQEYLSHGTIKSDDLRFQQAKLDDLIRDGLFDLFPAFKVSADELRAGLYEGQVSLRTIGYPPPEAKKIRKRKYESEEQERKRKESRRIYAYHDCPRVKPLTIELLTLVQKLTRNFINVGKGEDRSTMEPPLHIFLCFLTFEKRPSRDGVFIDWIKRRYDASDVRDIYTGPSGDVRPGFTRVADNLPGVMQYLDLLRDAMSAFDLPELPENVIELQNASTGILYAGQDDKYNRNKPLSIRYDKDKQQDERDEKRRKRHEKKEGEREAKKGGSALDKVKVSSKEAEREEARETIESEEIEDSSDEENGSDSEKSLRGTDGSDTDDEAASEENISVPLVGQIAARETAGAVGNVVKKIGRTRTVKLGMPGRGQESKPAKEVEADGSSEREWPDDVF